VILPVADGGDSPYLIHSPMSQIVPEPTRRPQVWAVGGGKGGTGKSLLTASLGIHLAERGRRVVLVDGDLGTPNLHTFLGLDPPAVALGDFIAGRVPRLEDAAVETGVAGLRIVSGARNALGAESLRHYQKARLLRLLSGLPADVVLVDLGAGTSLNGLDFFSVVDRGLLAILPEPTSVENCYRFLRAAWLRRLQRVCKILGHEPILELILRHRDAARAGSPVELLEEIDRIDAAAAGALAGHLETFVPRLVINQARDREDEALGDSMQIACERFLRIPLRFAGAIPFDPAVVRCVKGRRPFLREYPRSRTAAALRSVAEAVLEETRRPSRDPLVLPGARVARDGGTRVA
jgi:flagellar biosynthesis protein FlhG